MQIEPPLNCGHTERSTLRRGTSLIEGHCPCIRPRGVVGEGHCPCIIRPRGVVGEVKNLEHIYIACMQGISGLLYDTEVL